MSDELAPEEAEECTESAGEEGFLVRRRRLPLEEEEDPATPLLPLILFAEPAPPRPEAPAPCPELEGTPPELAAAIVRSAEDERERERESALSEDDDPNSFELDTSSFEFGDSVLEELSMLEDIESDSID